MKPFVRFLFYEPFEESLFIVASNYALQLFRPLPTEQPPRESGNPILRTRGALNRAPKAVRKWRRERLQNLLSCLDDMRVEPQCQWHNGHEICARVTRVRNRPR